MINTAINKDKSVLLTNNKKVSSPLLLQFGDKEITIENSQNPV